MRGSLFSYNFLCCLLSVYLVVSCSVTRKCAVMHNDISVLVYAFSIARLDSNYGKYSLLLKQLYTRSSKCLSNYICLSPPNSFFSYCSSDYIWDHRGQLSLLEYIYYWSQHSLMHINQ